jgi:Zn-dependent protease with chaperone function
VIDREGENALATPAGERYVFAGIPPLCQDEALAVILAPEIAHIVSRHFAIRMSLFLDAIFSNWRLKARTGRDAKGAKTEVKSSASRGGVLTLLSMPGRGTSSPSQP